MADNAYPTIVSFYTKTWEYEKYSHLMKMDCNRLNLAYNIKEVTKNDIWFNLTRIKPLVLKEILAEERRPILWIDVDGSLYHKPDFFKLPAQYDLMMKRKPLTHSRVWHVGTMFFNYNDRVLKFIDRWIEYTEMYPDASDELCLDHMWKAGEMEHLAIPADIPAEYFYMPPNQTPKPSTIIMHRESKGNDKKLR